MSAFPPSRTLIADSRTWYSRTATVSLTHGAAFDAVAYPLTTVVDGGAGGGAFRFDSGTGTIRVSLTSIPTDRFPNIFAVFGHNFDVDSVVNVMVLSSGMAILVNKGFRTRQPACWIDLTAYNLVAAQHYQLSFTGNSKPVILGEVAVAYGVPFVGTLGRPFTESIQMQGERGELEYGRIVTSVSGGITRTAPLRLTLSATDLTALREIDTEVQTSGSRVIVVPDSRRNDIWLCEWARLRDTLYPASTLVTETDLPLVEEAFGAY